jgi:hypothetical protein
MEIINMRMTDIQITKKLDLGFIDEKSLKLIKDHSFYRPKFSDT